MAAYINEAVWPQRDSVVKSVRTVLCQVYLNKLFIPDVLIDIIKDYLYLSEAEILKKFHRNCLNTSITEMSYSVSYLVDFYGRRRLAHWATGQDYYTGRNTVQLQQITCMTCGESSGYHTNLDGCCVLEYDGEDGTLELNYEKSLVSENEYDKENESAENEYVDMFDEDYDRYAEEKWYRAVSDDDRD